MGKPLPCWLGIGVMHERRQLSKDMEIFILEHHSAVAHYRQGICILHAQRQVSRDRDFFLGTARGRQDIVWTYCRM